MEDLKGQRRWCNNKVFFFCKCCFGSFLERKTHMKGGEAEEAMVEEGMGITKQLTGVGKSNF
jgi:hypothetical protein